LIIILATYANIKPNFSSHGKWQVSLLGIGSKEYHSNSTILRIAAVARLDILFPANSLMASGTQ